MEHIHAVVTNKLHTAEINMANLVKASDTNDFLSDAAWAICSPYHTVLKTSPGTSIFEQDMLFDIPFIAEWKKIGEHRQQLTELNTMIMITRLVKMCLYRMMVYSKKQIPGI